jgi:hypothetical protein
MKVVTLCGSTHFKEEYIRKQEELTLQGIIVVSVGVFVHADNVKVSPKTAEMLCDMHKRKIDMADEILVINKNCYVGQGTQDQIDYAISKGKKVSYMFSA